MPVNPNIALAVKPLELANPMNAMLQATQLQQAQMQMETYQRDRDALSRIQSAIVANGGPPDLGAAADEMIKSGKPEYMMQGMAIRQKLNDQKAFAQYQAELTPPAGAAPTGGAAPINAMAAAGAPAAPTAPVNAMVAQPDIAALENRYRRVANLDTPGAKAEAALLLKQIDRAATATPSDIKMMQSLGYPLTQQGFKEFRDAYRADRLLSPEEEAQKVRIAAASRAPVQPVAPTITQIVDPANPNRMITVDARRYTGGTVGSPGVLGVGGKEPGAAVRENKAEAGKTQLADDLDNLRASFAALDQMRAIPSTERNPLSNVASSVAASRAGQLAGQAFATEAQVERDVINSARTRLVNSIKNATGMSAQQLNSNVELQTMLKSISDPGQSYQSAMRIIDDIENAYVKGAGMPKKKPPAAGGAPAAGGPNIDELLQKYK